MAIINNKNLTKVKEEKKDTLGTSENIEAKFI